MKTLKSPRYGLVGYLNGQLIRFDLFDGPNLVGRDGTSQISLNAGHISRFHAVLDVVSNGVRITDLHSLNGTFVENRKVGLSHVAVGSRIAFGPLIFVLERLPGLGESGVCGPGRPGMVQRPVVEPKPVGLQSEDTEENLQIQGFRLQPGHWVAAPRRAKKTA